MTESAVVPSNPTPAPRKPGRRASMESTYSSARGAASNAIESATDAARRAAESVEANPMSVLAGGVALGIIAGLFVPRTRREEELLAPVGAKLRAGASTAAAAAVDAGRAELAAVGLSRIAANEQVGKLIEGLGKAVTSAGAAAKESRKRK